MRPGSWPLRHDLPPPFPRGTASLTFKAKQNLAWQPQGGMGQPAALSGTGAFDQPGAFSSRSGN